jgi:hypothetical protein
MVEFEATIGKGSPTFIEASNSTIEAVDYLIQ